MTDAPYKVEQEAPAAGENGEPRAWEPPRILWSEEIQTLAYTCNSGPAPVSGTNCPPT